MRAVSSVLPNTTAATVLSPSPHKRPT